MQSSRVGEYTIWYENAEEFYELRKEIFTEHRYYTELESEKPKIVDVGAHIGMVVVYFKICYPDSTIVAYEPEPSNFALLKKNVKENQLSGVTILNQAVAPKGGTLELYVPIQEEGWKSGAGIIPRGWRGVQDTKSCKVEAVGINEVLQSEVDLLKMDIEGMEYEVVERADLSRVGRLIVEIHPRKGKREQDVIRRIEGSGMRVEREVDQSRYGVGLTIIKARRGQ